MLFEVKCAYVITVFITQPLPRLLMRMPPPPPFNIRKRSSTRLAVAVKHGLHSSQYSPGTAASVMARPGTLCIATVTVLVILAAAVQPGERYLTASICTCTYTQWFVSVQIAYKVKQLVTLKFVFLLHVLHHVVLMFLIHHENDRSNVSC